NPIMRYYLRYGLIPFALAKLVLVIAPVVIIEWGRQHRPRTVRTLARVGVLGYLVLYAGMFFTINVPSIMMAARFDKEATELPAVSLEELMRERARLDKSSFISPNSEQIATPARSPLPPSGNLSLSQQEAQKVRNPEDF
ncbi:MAG: DUF5658 family protein, partial [Bryobacteraceae bacterium]|nr:DUF5658 family protein [Bryobacteraceae bacterium]